MKTPKLSSDAKWIIASIASLTIGVPVLAYGLTLQLGVASEADNLAAGIVQFVGLLCLTPAMAALPDLFVFNTKGGTSSVPASRIPGWTPAMLLAGFAMVMALALLVSSGRFDSLAWVPLVVIPLAVHVGARYRLSILPAVASATSIVLLYPMIL